MSAFQIEKNGKKEEEIDDEWKLVNWKVAHIDKHDSDNVTLRAHCESNVY